MKKFVIAAAAVGALGLGATAASAQMMVEQYSAPSHTTVVEGRNTYVPSGASTSRDIPDAYVDGNWDANSIYDRAPGVEPYIAKQIDQDHKGEGN